MVYVDLNDGIGLQKVGGTWEYDEENTPCVTKLSATKENIAQGAGEQFRELLCRHRMVAISVNEDRRPTWFGHEGRSSTIDFLAVPVGAAEGASKAGTLAKLARRMQIIKVKAKADHVPVFANLECAKTWHSVDDTTWMGNIIPGLGRTKWDMDALMRGAKEFV